MSYRTKSGRTLTDADIEALADEAERGYDVSHLKGREFEGSARAILGRLVRWMDAGGMAGPELVKIIDDARALLEWEKR